MCHGPCRARCSPGSTPITTASSPRPKSTRLKRSARRRSSSARNASIATTIFAQLDANHDGKITGGRSARRDARTGQGSDSPPRHQPTGFAAACSRAPTATRTASTPAPSSTRRAQHEDAHGARPACAAGAATHVRHGRRQPATAACPLAEAQRVALQHFDRADLNHDGKLTPEERKQAHQRCPRLSASTRLGASAGALGRLRFRRLARRFAAALISAAMLAVARLGLGHIIAGDRQRVAVADILHLVIAGRRRSRTSRSRRRDRIPTSGRSARRTSPRSSRARPWSRAPASGAACRHNAAAGSRRRWRSAAPSRSPPHICDSDGRW